MKRLLVGLLIGITLMIPVSAAAAVRTVGLPDAKIIYNINDDNIENHRQDSVHVFDDQDNKCYVMMRGYESQAISCVKQ